jgi:transposase-like protein/transposase
MGRPSPFIIHLSEEDRAELDRRVRCHTAEQRQVTRAWIVLMAGAGEDNVAIAASLGVAPNTVLKWRKRFFEEGLEGLVDRPRSGRPKRFCPRVVAQVKAIACELPVTRGLPLSRLSASDIVSEVIDAGVVEAISVSTVARWLAADALRPWRHRSWIFPRDPCFVDKAGVVLDLYEGRFGRRRLRPNEFVISADEKTSIQARCRCHPTLAPAQARAMRVEHEYERAGALAYMAAWDVHRGVLMGRCEPKTGIGPFGRLVADVMSVEPYASARRVFFVVDNGSSHRGHKAAERLREQWPRARLVHLPVHASWLNQIEIIFSIIQRKVLTPNDLTDLDQLAARLLAFEARFNATAQPFDWHFTRAELAALLGRLEERTFAAAA